MVAVPSPGGPFCIDQTEVTQQEYAAFLAAAPPPDPDELACNGNDFYPTCPEYEPVGNAQFPVVCVDWCDAVRYCKFIGKRLCGKIDGGAVSIVDADNADHSQWFRACSKAGAQAFPYGPTYDADKCHGLDSGDADFDAVATFPQCVGGYPGIYDMSGNVREWEYGCSAGECLQRGGHYLDSSSDSPHSLRCDSDGTAPRMSWSEKVGFRCCADL